MAHGFAVSFIRLLFNNSEEVKRIRFSQTGFVWVVIALLVSSISLVMSTGALYTPELTKRFLWFRMSRRVVFRVIGSSEQVHVVDALATTGDEGRCSLR